MTSKALTERMYSCHECEGWAAAAALLFEGAQEIERLQREQGSLLAAIGDHVTVRSEQYAQIQRLHAALEESVALQSHYAYLLNAYDEGERRGFASADAWIKRLVEVGKLAELARRPRT